jgi:hypothetical protein
MPETRLERALFVLGLAAIAALCVLIVHYRHNTSTAAPLASTAALTTSPAATDAVTERTRKKAAPAHPTRPTSETIAPTQTATATPTTTAAAPATTTSPLAATTTAPTTAATTSAAATTELVLTASRGDSWLEVRSGSSTGTILYTGTLTAGSTKTFQAASIWVRFGAASNLDASLNGSTLALPLGTYSALFDSGGFQKVRG